MFFDFLTGKGHVCAHRGARSLAPENTLLAAKVALESGADFWELDVHKVADGTLMIFHDDVLSRTTDVATHPYFVGGGPWEAHVYTGEELRQLDAGSWFLQTDPFGSIARGDIPAETLEEMPGLKIPTLREALEFCRKHDFPVNVEIKDQFQSPGDLSIVEEVLHVARETDTTDLILLSSFNHAYLTRMRYLAPDLPLAALVEKEHPEDIRDYLKRLGAKGYHPREDILDSGLAQSLSSEGIQVSPFTVNDMEQAQSLLDAGCFGIITDFPHTLRDRIPSDACCRISA
ncbi:glycerophosphodiester phosphodiesterase [Pseudodesulfovibrio sp. JC047]|uniref:glycerophosphodiester phosphodiesterase family protein n=1 Tax=Pseudodesulfovibrio sp. JC047 TaxID=2683199 RepID=UPI0013D10123|nr:glycerophosphodiester phosphodiesterase [Pseudodesulfovibrio sp. JC047]